MRGRTARRRRYRRYLERAAATRPDDPAPPCISRWWDREVHRSRVALVYPPPKVMNARTWYRLGMDARITEARAQADSNWRVLID